MSLNLKIMLKKIARTFGYEIHRRPALFENGMEHDFRDIYMKIQNLHGQTVERLYALYQSVHYVIKNNIPGDFVECGVYKGASGILIAETLKTLGSRDRAIWLYDTYQGMPEPTERDQDMLSLHRGQSILQARGFQSWGEMNCASLDEVKLNLAKTHYPESKIFYVKGKVEETLPQNSPAAVALLRLDTDWYASTLHELQCLYPKISGGGLLMIDDYGHWQGAKDAVDEYFASHRINLLMHRVDYTCRMGIKTNP